MTKVHEEAQDVIAMLDAMLEAIRSAQFDKLGEFSAKLETFLSDPPPMNRMTLTQIRRLTKRNSECLQAAAQGLRAGRRRLAEITAAGRADTYDRHGARAPLSLHPTGRRL